LPPRSCAGCKVPMYSTCKCISTKLLCNLTMLPSIIYNVLPQLLHKVLTAERRGLQRRKDHPILPIQREGTMPLPLVSFASKTLLVLAPKTLWSSLASRAAILFELCIHTETHAFTYWLVSYILAESRHELERRLLPFADPAVCMHTCVYMYAFIPMY
jgi:hypothetical protein